MARSSGGGWRRDALASAPGCVACTRGRRSRKAIQVDHGVVGGAGLPCPTRRSCAAAPGCGSRTSSALSSCSSSSTNSTVVRESSHRGPPARRVGGVDAVADAAAAQHAQVGQHHRPRCWTGCRPPRPARSPGSSGRGDLAHGVARSAPRSIRAQMPSSFWRIQTGRPRCARRSRTARHGLARRQHLSVLGWSQVGMRAPGRPSLTSRCSSSSSAARRAPASFMPR